MLDLERRARLKNTLKTKCKIVRRAAHHRCDGMDVKEDAKQVIMSQPTIQPIDLNLLPTFEGVKNLADIQARFFPSARAIMLGHDLEIKGKKFSITSLELYLKLHKQKDIWWDAATDKDEDANEQFNHGTWYLRRKKAQRRWRIDITVGNASECIQAGILIRQLDGLGGQQPGPATALHRIVRDEFGDIPFEPEQLALLDKIHGKQID